MNRLPRALLRLETDLRVLGLSWALIGGLAVSARAEPRTTRDLDVAIAVEEDREAEGLIPRFWGRGYRMKTAPLEQLETGRMATVRLVAPGEKEQGVVVDLFFASSGIEREIVAAADELEVFSGVTMPVATLGHLLALKTLAGRYQDLMDIETLLRYAELRDVQQAREALELISRRGFDRGKDLQVEFAKLVARGPRES